MKDPLLETVQLAGNSLRFAWFSGVNWVSARVSGPRPPVKLTRPVPPRREIMAELRALLARDAAAAGKGLFPPLEDEAEGLAAHLLRLAKMFADLPQTAERRREKQAGTVRTLASTANLPAYFVQDFHYQTGGYLGESSARLYDVQVETLFYGSANAMRRTCLSPVAAFIAGKDQRQLALLDLACGTGRFLRQARLAYPALNLTGLDLSQAYLDEARRHLGRLKPAAFLAANAEEIPLADGSQNIVTCIFLYHELPREVRRRVTKEVARILAPGGLLVFLDSLQYGDRPSWDGLLEAFPARFHEPYYKDYLEDDLRALFQEAGLACSVEWTAFLSKGMAWRKSGGRETGRPAAPSPVNSPEPVHRMPTCGTGASGRDDAAHPGA